ncbi:hypothetical protein Bbelb_073410 [Branchiostoma belcheri]|nr:hypothetical protein Bbelb_073410 [Branchiostoma belcheri]
MAEDLNSDSVRNVVRNDSSSDSTTEPGTRTVPPTVRQTDEDVNNYISGTCEENEHDDDEHLSIQSDSAFENRETVQISPGDFDTYAIAYTCKAHDTCIKKNVEQTKSKAFQGSNTASSHHDENDTHLAECGSVQNYTDTFNGNDGNMRIQARNPNPMYTHKTVNHDPIHSENKVFPNPMYLQSTREVSNASHGSAFKPSEPYQELNNSRTQAMDSNSMCTHNTTTPYPLHPKNDVNQDRVYTHLQNTIEPSNASPGSTFMSSMPSGDVPCTLTSADTQNNPECNAALSDTQPKLPSQDLPSAASNDINDVLSNPLSDINGVLNALNPNPIYVPNVQNSAASDDTTLEAFFSLWDLSLAATRRCLRAVVAALSPRSQQSPTPHNAMLLRNGGMTSAVETVTLQEMGGPLSATLTVPGHAALRPTGVETLQDTVTVLAVSTTIISQVESGDRKLENVITIRGNRKDPIMMAKGVALADNEIFVTTFNGVRVFSINGIYLRHFHTPLPGKNIFIMPIDVGIGIEPGHLWVVGPILTCGVNEGRVQVVTYSRSGQAMKKFDVGSTRPFYDPVIAIDVRNNKIIVGQGKTVKMFDPDGSLCRSFKALSDSEGRIGGVTSDSEGNILLTFVKSAFKAVAMYSHSGVKIVEIAGRDKGRLYNFYGISRDKLGNIIVADNENNRVDMFTSRGEFVRTIANIQEPMAIAIGPDGEMVVTTNVAHLDEMPRTGSTVYSMPIKIGQGSGAPARVSAIVDGRTSGAGPTTPNLVVMLWKCFRT